MVGILIGAALCLFIRPEYSNATYHDPGFPAPKGPCEVELENFCSNVKPGEGRLQECLARYEKSLSPECKEYLKKESVTLSKIQKDCGDDALTYCENIRVSFRRILECLKDHRNEVSHGCREFLQKQK